MLPDVLMQMFAVSFSMFSAAVMLIVGVRNNAIVVVYDCLVCIAEKALADRSLCSATIHRDYHNHKQKHAVSSTIDVSFSAKRSACDAASSGTGYDAAPGQVSFVRQGSSALNACATSHAALCSLCQYVRSGG